MCVCTLRTIYSVIGVLVMDRDHHLKKKNIYKIKSKMLCAFLYIFFAIWSWFKDRRDKKKLGVYWLTDNFPNDSYFYQLFVFTGTKSESETKSKVNYF